MNNSSPKPTPLPIEWIHLNQNQVDRHRNQDCTLYDSCLDKAAIEHWAGWTCKYCPYWMKETEQ